MQLFRSLSLLIFPEKKRMVLGNGTFSNLVDNYLVGCRDLHSLFLERKRVLGWLFRTMGVI